MTTATLEPATARLLSVLSPEQLRHVAACAEARTSASRARVRLSDTSIEEYSRFVLAGQKPTVGWWRRHAWGRS